MLRTVRTGFTLVEILIVVVILGILAAIVVPQFASASEDATKSALRSQMQTISGQIELYRVQKTGSLPLLVVGKPNDISDTGWEVLTTGGYLKDAPRNGYTQSTHIGAVNTTAAATAVTGLATTTPATDGTVGGWIYNSTLGRVIANGYDHIGNVLVGEPSSAGYTAPTW